MKTALLLIDIQNDYFPGGRNPLEGSPEAARQAAKLLDFFRRRNLPLVHVQHISTRPGASFFLPDTDGVLAHAAVRPLEDEKLIQKHFPNSFRETALLETLRAWEIQRLAIGGMMTHMCVDASVRAAADLGFECWLAQDACATKALQFGERLVPAEHVQLAFLAALKGSYASVMPVEQILHQLG